MDNGVLTIIDIQRLVSASGAGVVVPAAGAAVPSGGVMVPGGGVQLAPADGVAYFNNVVTAVNDHVVRVSVMTQPYFWHCHPNSDETFLVVEGSIFIDLEEKTVELFPGQLFTIPRKVKHRTRPNGARSVNLTVESADLETVKME